MRITTTTIATIFALGWLNVVAAEEQPFPFVISYDAPENVTNLSAWLQRPAGKYGFVHERRGHFATDAGPIRFWGTNLCGLACFPTHEEAQRVAARLARLGMNCVRLHHMDGYAIWGDSPNRLTIDPKQLERLDYLVHQLKLHGLYTNLNLHVSRWFDEAEGFVDRQRRPKYDKGLDNFEPRMLELQKKYARDLLTHVNPYTKTSYAEEPGVAFIEISNEDALFGVWHSGQLDDLPDPYATTFRKLWNAWLRHKYGGTDKLRTAWSEGATTAQSDELLRNVDFAQPLDGIWQLQRDEHTKAELSIESDRPNEGRRILRLVVARTGQSAWSPQLSQSGLVLKRGVIYTFTCRWRCDAVQRCEVTCQMAHAPYEPLGLATPVEVGPRWHQYRFIFVADRDDTDARIGFTQFQPGAYDLADVSLRSGGIVGLGADQRLEDDSVPTLCRLFATVPASRDFCDFLWGLEHDYWQGMYRYLKDQLHVRSLVAGTQLNYSPPHVQAGLDYVDKHAYWEHPTFPGRSWDLTNWYVNDIALVNNPGGSLARLASSRIAGKPYTVSEYNHPAPNSHAAEGFPMIAAFGAFQNWDGICSFAYSSNREFEPGRIVGFFDIKSSTAQLAHLPACAAMFLRGDVAPANRIMLCRLAREDERRKLHEARNAWKLTADKLAGDARCSLIHATALDLRDRDPKESRQEATELRDKQNLSDTGRFVSDTGEICWDVSLKNAGYWTVNTRRTKLFSGFVRGRTFPLGDVILKIGATRLDWATVSMTAIDGAGIGRPGRILVAATGWARNQDMKPEQLGNNRITLGEQWGNGPVVCEGICATITLPVPAERVKCYPLDESGNRRAAISLGGGKDAVQVELAPRHKTLWYEVDIQP